MKRLVQVLPVQHGLPLQLQRRVQVHQIAGGVGDPHPLPLVVVEDPARGWDRRLRLGLLHPPPRLVPVDAVEQKAHDLVDLLPVGGQLSLVLDLGLLHRVDCGGGHFVDGCSGKGGDDV